MEATAAMRGYGWVILLAGVALAAEEKKAGGPAEGRAPFYLLVDHVSPVLYEGEPLTVCFRVENTTGSEGVVEVSAEAQGPGDTKVKEDRRKVTLPANAQVSCRFDVDLKGVRAVRFQMVTPQGQVSGPQVSAIRAQDAWPQGKVVDGRLTDVAKGDVLVPVVTRRERKEERSFSTLSWLVPKKKEEGKSRPVNTFLFLPAEWLGEKAVLAPEWVPGELLEAKAWKAYGPCLLEGVPAVLVAAGECARNLPQPAPERVVVLLPAGDLETSVDPRLYRTVVEVLLSRLETAGVREVAILPPLRYGAPEALNRMLRKAVKEALEGRPARSLDVAPFLDETFWRLDPATPGVYGRQPNAVGRKKIRQALADLIP